MTIKQVDGYGSYFRSQFKKLFAGRLSKKEQEDIYLDYMLWHLCSYQKVDYLSGNTAVERFEKIKKKKISLFFQFSNTVFVVENEVNFNSAKLNETVQYFDSSEVSDCYVMDYYGEWCFITTHEQDYGLGPYFIENNC